MDHTPHPHTPQQHTTPTPHHIKENPNPHSPTTPRNTPHLQFSDNTEEPDSTIPVDASSLDRSPIFTNTDYPATITGHPRTKLITSQIAPLVATARGYRTTSAQEQDTWNAELTRDVSANTARTRRTQIRTLFEHGQSLAMPWYSVTDLAAARSARPAPAMWQFRPDEPIPTGKTDSTGAITTKKYDMPAGSTVVIDAHPATPPEWLDDPNVPIIFTEGILKADSTLSALLLDTPGLSSDDLAAPHHPDTDTARMNAWQHLRELLRTLQPANRHVILAAVGVSSWHRADWMSTIRLKDGRRFHIAFDGDMARNPSVWRQSEQLWRTATTRGANVDLIDLTVPLESADHGTKKPQLGLDDFFGAPRYLRFREVLSPTRLLNTMPPMPDAGITKGTWRVHPSGTHIQQAIEVPSGDDGTTTLTWSTQISFGARIARIIDTDIPTPEEIDTGTLLNEGPDPSVSVEIEFTWLDEAGEQRTATVTGTQEILEQTPANWTKQAGAEIPRELAVLPDWPPRYKKGEGFMEAMKSHRPELIESAIAWDSMGWCPTPDGPPVFLIGNKQITVTGEESPRIITGVAARNVPGAERIGLPDLPYEPDNPRFETFAGRTIASIAALFLGQLPDTEPEDQVFTRPEYGAMILLAGMRPLLPSAPHSTLYLWGPPGKGKSYLAGVAMSFWQPRPGAFPEGSLPGSASDSIPVTANAISRVPLWMMDDVSPKQSSYAADKQVADVEEMIRSVFNGKTPGRMRQGKDGEWKARPIRASRAMFLVTGEMPPSTSSIRQRTVMLGMDGSALGQLEQMDRHRDRTNLMGRFTRLCLEAMLAKIREDGWAEIQRALRSYRAFLDQWLATKAPFATRRSRTMMVELGMSAYLVRLVGWKFIQGTGDMHTAARMHEACLHLEEDLNLACVKMLELTRFEQEEATPGVRLMEAIISLLKSGDGYIAAGDGSANPPLSDSPEDAAANNALGWPGGHTKPGAELIGYLRGEDVDGHPVVLLDAIQAFDLAQRLRPRKAGGFGADKSASWSSAWESGVVADTGRKRFVRAGGKEEPYIQARIGGTARIYAVPVRLAKLIGAEELIDTEREVKPQR